jgi:hypothetical protein
MKKLKLTDKISKEIIEIESLINKMGVYLQSVSNSCDIINTEYTKNIKKLLKKIAEGENLNYEMLKEKYLKSSPKENLELNNTTNDEKNTIVEPLEIIFDKIIIDNKNYYYENKELGKIYDSLSNIVGVYKNKNFILN